MENSSTVCLNSQYFKKQIIFLQLFFINFFLIFKNFFILMKRILSLALITVVCATESDTCLAEESIFNDDIYTGIVSNQENIENEMTQCAEKCNTSGVSFNACNPCTFEDDEIECVLNTFHFSLLKRIFSLTLYNMPELKAIFTRILAIRESLPIRKNPQIKMNQLKNLLFSSSSLSEIQSLKNILEENKNAEGEQLHNLIKYCKRYLIIRNIKYDDLKTLDEFKERIYTSNLYFNKSDDELNQMKIDKAFVISKLLCDDSYNKKMTMLFLNWCYPIYEIILAFHAVIYQSDNLEPFSSFKKKRLNVQIYYRKND